MIPILVAAVLLLAAGAAAVLVARRRRRDARDMARRLALATSTVRMPDGGALPLPDALWALSAPGAVDVVADAVRGCGTDDPQSILIAAMSAVDALDPDRRRDYQQTAHHIRALDRDCEAWDQQMGLLGRGLETGMLDVAVVGLAQADILRNAVSSTVGALASSAVSVPLPDAVVPDFLSAFETQVGDAAGMAVGEVLGAVADAHIPILTMISAVRAARAASDAGLESSRVTDNLVADIGLKGGGMVAGAAVGTAILPVVGTVIGGFLGALAGGGAANTVKARHLEAAEDALAAEFERLGSGIPLQRWRLITADAAGGLSRQREAAALLDAQVARLPERPVDRTVGDLALAHTTRSAVDDILCRQQTLDGLREAVDEFGDADCASERGAILASSPELRRRLRLPDDAAARCLARCATVDDERRKLALA